MYHSPLAKKEKTSDISEEEGDLNIMAKVTPNQYAEKWGRRLTGSISDIERGVDNLDTAPSQSAIAAEQKFRTNLDQALNEGRWVQGLQRYSLQDYKNDMKTKGLQRISSGVSSALPSQVRMATNLLAAVDSAASAARALPDNSLQDSINRMAEFVTRMHQAKGTIRVK